MASGERKRCSNIAPDFRLRSLAWMNARRLPGVRCSTLKTRCSWSLCLMIMPGRSWVAGIAMRKLLEENRNHSAEKFGPMPSIDCNLAQGASVLQRVVNGLKDFAEYGAGPDCGQTQEQA